MKIQQSLECSVTLGSPKSNQVRSTQNLCLGYKLTRCSLAVERRAIKVNFLTPSNFFSLPSIIFLSRIIAVRHCDLSSHRYFTGMQNQCIRSWECLAGQVKVFMVVFNCVTTDIVQRQN